MTTAMTRDPAPADARRDPRQAALRTAWLLGALALAFFAAAFFLLPR